MESEWVKRKSRSGLMAERSVGLGFLDDQTESLHRTTKVSQNSLP